jgi:hypothetical protein
MRAVDGFTFKNIGATTAPFQLVGGIYQVTAVGFTGGTAQLCELGPDGATWLGVRNAFSANGGDTLYLPQGTYQWQIASEASVSLGIYRVPGE